MKENLDKHIEELRYALVKKIPLEERDYSLFKLNTDQLKEISGDIEYCLSKICSSLIFEKSPEKIELMKNVLENVKSKL